ncbi:porin [Pseudoduganella violacea]|uniref:Putative porin n=1 Tax=Pseudoduganella violacea TaxID=1715466 RepID=A0A7W5B7Z9_9BURK|nr:porin [Pseudoduganella violacea]MBB3117480.1 putative porin [Pseudoduganella violacea]
MTRLFLLAVCSFCTLAVPALGQTQVTVMGVIDAYVGTLRNSGDATRRNVVGSGGMTTSYFGFKGREELGGGLRAEFALTGSFLVDTGASGRFAGDPMFSRDANVALAGPFGRLMFGRAAAPNFLSNVQFNPFGNSFTFSPLMLHSYIPSGPAGARNWTPSSAGDSGWSNQIAYTTPEVNGLKASVHFQPGERQGLAGMNNIAANVFYARGPLALTAFVHRVRESNPNQGNPIIDAMRAPINYAAVDNQRAYFGGIAYDFAAVKLYATFQRTFNNTPTGLHMNDRVASVGLSSRQGPGSVLFGYANTRRDGSLFGPERTRATATLGYLYPASKRSELYVLAMTDRVSGKPRATSAATGIRHSF